MLYTWLWISELKNGWLSYNNLGFENSKLPVDVHNLETRAILKDTDILSSGKQGSQKKWFHVVFICAAGIKTMRYGISSGQKSIPHCYFLWTQKDTAPSAAVISCGRIGYAMFFWNSKIHASHFSKDLWNIELSSWLKQNYEKEMV